MDTDSPPLSEVGSPTGGATVTDPLVLSVLQVSAQAREQALAMVDLVLALSALPPPPVADDGDGDDATQAERAAALRREAARQQKVLVAHLARLRGLHRAACLSARETKAQTGEAKRELDRLHLQLQNLYYEQRHLQGEIAACEGFDHTYQKLPLISVDEFLAQHPEHADDDEDTLMIARIDHERVEREKLEQQRQELLKRKQKLIADNKKRKEDLASLDKDLEKFIDAAKPIQKLFEKVI